MRTPGLPMRKLRHGKAEQRPSPMQRGAGRLEAAAPTCEACCAARGTCATRQATLRQHTLPRPLTLTRHFLISALDEISAGSGDTKMKEIRLLLFSLLPLPWVQGAGRLKDG